MKRSRVIEIKGELAKEGKKEQCPFVSSYFNYAHPKSVNLIESRVLCLCRISLSKPLFYLLSNSLLSGASEENKEAHKRLLRLETRNGEMVREKQNQPATANFFFSYVRVNNEV